jgi:hypothetical protein
MPKVPQGETLWLLLSVLVLSVSLGAGCSKGGSTAETEDRMRKLLPAVFDYLEAASKQPTGPPNDAGFKTYLAGLSKQKLADLRITNTEEVLTSPRDQKPFVINYALSLSGGSAPAIWEQTGAGGRRYVLYQDGKAEEVDDETFNKLMLKLKK